MSTYNSSEKKHVKSYEELEFTDDFLFCKIMENNVDLCKELTELIVSFSEIESPSLLVRRGSLSLLRWRKSNLVRIQQVRHPSRRIRWWRSAS